MSYYKMTAAYLLADKLTIIGNNVKAVLKDSKNEALMTKKLKDIKAQEYDIGKCFDEIQFLYKNDLKKIEELHELVNRLIKGAHTICDKDKLAVMEDFMIDMYKTFIDGLGEKVEDLLYSICRYSDGDAEYFLAAKTYAIPNMSYQNEHYYGLEAGRQMIMGILSPLLEKRTHNILFSNLEYMVNTMKDVHAAMEDKAPQRLYATYNNNNGTKIDVDERKLLAKVAIGQPSTYRAQNGAFDVAVHRFTHTIKYHDEDRTTEIVKPSNLNRDLDRIARYLREGGLALVLVPNFLFKTKEILSLKNTMQYLWSVKLPDPVDGAQYALAAFRHTKNMTEEEQEQNFQNLLAMSNSTELTDEMAARAIKHLPTGDCGEVRLLAGGLIDKAVLEIVLQESTIHGIFKTPPKTVIRPLLPLKKGQIGQMIASGKLDGIIDEGDGHKHVIRGRVYKGTVHSSTVDYDDPNNATETHKVIENNLVEINVFAGDGTYKTIAVAG